MSRVIVMPSALPVMRQVWGIRSADMRFSNALTGSGQTQVGGPPRRTCSLVSEAKIPQRAEGAMWRVLLHDLGGTVNRVAVHDTLRPLPLGTARGTWTADAAAAGAMALTINAGAAQAGRTLLAGDWIGVHQESVFHRQLLLVMADAVADTAGRIAVRTALPLRADLPAGGPVAWDRPTCLMQATSSEQQWTLESRQEGGYAIDLVERWET